MNTIEKRIRGNPNEILIAVSKVLTEIIEKINSKSIVRIEDQEKIAKRIAVQIGIYLENNNIGELYGADATFMIGENERMPDVSFVSNEKLKGGEPVTKAIFRLI